MRRSIHCVKNGDIECTGVIEIVAGLAKYSQQYGYETTVLFFKDGPLAKWIESRGNPTHTILWDGTARDLTGLMRVWLWLLKHPAEVLHLHWGGRLLRALCKLSGAKVIIRHLHGRIDESTGRVSREIPIPWSDGVIACSQSVAECVKANRIEVIPSGIDTEPLRAERKAQEGPLTMGVLSRLIPAKNIEASIEATALLEQRGLDVRLEIAGSGPSEETLRELVAKLRAEKLVAFLGWRNDLNDLFAGWDVLVMLSVDEGFPIAALQAMAAAKPVIASGAGGLGELVVDNVTGRIIPDASASALADCIEELARDRNLLIQMGEAGWRRARDEFSVPRMAERTFCFYDLLLKKRRYKNHSASA